jgi:Domain of unknown function (DUF4390)
MGRPSPPRPLHAAPVRGRAALPPRSRGGAAPLLAALILLPLAVPLSARAELAVRVAAPGESLDSTAVGSPPVPGDTLLVAFRLDGVLGTNDDMGAGIPATLILVVDLWRERSGWWDQMVRSQAFGYRFRGDLWSGVYEVVNPDGSTSHLDGRDALRAHLERVHEVLLGTAGDFTPGERYYVTVRAILKPLELDDLQKVDAWLSGDVTGSRGGGGILGIPKALAKLVVDVSGLGDETATGRSAVFVPRR